MLQATPGQLVFGLDIILNTLFIANWEDIIRHKQKLIDKNNQLENRNCKLHTYGIGDKVLMSFKKENEYKETYISLCTITQVWKNGNITIRRCAVEERIDIRLITPYHK